jgi:hypothetical protein
MIDPVLLLIDAQNVTSPWFCWSQLKTIKLFILTDLRMEIRAILF